MRRTLKGLEVEDACPDFQEIEVREDDQNDETENIIVDNDIQLRYNLRNRKINMTSVQEEQLKKKKAFTSILNTKTIIQRIILKLIIFG